MRALTRCDLFILVVKLIWSYICLFVWTWLLFSPLIFKFEISTYSQQSNKSHNFNSLSSLYLIEKVLFLDEFFFYIFESIKTCLSPSLKTLISNMFIWRVFKIWFDDYSIRDQILWLIFASNPTNETPNCKVFFDDFGLVILFIIYCEL